MDARARIDGFLAQFGRERGLTLSLDDKGVGVVARGSATVQIHTRPDQGVLLLLAPVMPVPEAGAEAFYRRLLELSFLQTSDAAFAIDRATNLVYLRILRRLEGIDYEEFEDLLGTIARVADQWDDALRNELGGAA